MKKLLLVLFVGFIFSTVNAQSEYTTNVVFPANYQVGDYIEFVGVSPIAAGASGNYEISIAYTRGNIAAASTHLTSVSHANPAIWREAGKINGNPYVSNETYNFTIDVNGQYNTPRFRVRAIATNGVLDDIVVYIKMRAINANNGWTPLNYVGNDVTVDKFMPMTDEWSLYVGNAFSTSGAALAIKAIENGNVGIGTKSPDEKLTVNGKVHAKEIRVDGNAMPDYVFEENYQLFSLKQTEAFIKKNKHLPEVPSAEEADKNGLELGEMNKLLLKKIEELTLHLIEKDKIIDRQELRLLAIEKKLKIN
jgi:hypothetical protein